jgi:hypothetical protein
MKYSSVALKFAAAAGALFSTAALASVSLTVSGNSVSGFIGKSDVQSAYHFTDAQMQQYANVVIFNFSDHLVVNYTCGSAAYVQNIDRSATLQDSYTGTSKKTAIVAGWSVSGTLRASSPGSSTVPQVGDSCPSGSPGQVTSVDVVETNPVLTASTPSRGMVFLDTSGIVVE